LFLTVLESGKSKIKVFIDSIQGPSSWPADGHFLAVFLHGLYSMQVYRERKRERERERDAFSS
jgi:hypothetical protein